MVLCTCNPSPGEPNGPLGLAGQLVYSAGFRPVNDCLQKHGGWHPWDDTHSYLLAFRGTCTHMHVHAHARTHNPLTKIHLSPVEYLLN